MIRYALLLPLMACAAPDLADAFSQMELHIDATPEGANARFADFVSTAKQSVHVAIPTDRDGAIAEAVIAAWNRGLDVEVVTDVDEAQELGVVAMIEAGVPVQLADGELSYFDFNSNNDVYFSSDQTVMSDTWAVVDGARALAGTRAGAIDSGETVFFEITGEELIEDLLSEHRQIFHGTDATATTSFDGLAKSIVDVRWRYPTQTDLDLELWFGPQERLVKRMIDAIYSTRGSVYLLTNDLTDAGLARALQDKAKNGFPVTAIVGPAYNRTSSRPARVFNDETPDVEKLRYTGADDLPTVLIVDWEKARDGRAYEIRAFVLSHDLYSTSRIDGAEVLGPDEPALGKRTDQLIDGTLWVLRDYDEASKPTQDLFDLWTRHLDAAGAL